MQINLDLFFFHHDDKLRNSLQSLEQTENCHLVDLTKCALPESLIEWCAEFPELAAILSEYTGHMAIKPTSDLIGVFNYSLFQKFSFRWALKNGRSLAFLPKITQEALLGRHYDTGYLSYVEAASAHNLWKFYEDIDVSSDVIEFFKSRYPLPDDVRVPLKGSYILDRDTFLAYQDWLVREIPILLEVLKDVEGGPVSKFSESRLGDKAYTRTQQARHIIGGGCERIAGWFLAQRYMARHTVRIGEFFRRKPQSLEDAARLAADDNGNVVLVFCNSDYKPILENWICNTEVVGEVPLVVCALDDQLANDLAEIGFHTCHIPWSGKLPDLWRLRLLAIRDLVKLGFNVTHSDSDAVWLKDPLPILNDISADVVASQGTVWPRTALAAWEHVLCFGFICFRSSQATQKLLDRMVDKALEVGDLFDDQKVLNELLVDARMEWEFPKDGYSLKLKESAFVCHKETILGVGELEEGTPIQVGLLPHRQFQRLPNTVERSEDRVVAHPYADKNAGDTEKVLRRENCWFI